MTLDDHLARELHELEGKNRLRAPETFTGPDRIHSTSGEGIPLLSFSSNDYLGLAAHPAVARAAAEAALEHGVGSGASRLVTGESPPHRRLEAALARYLDVEGVLLFPTGYQANIGTITALAGPGDLIASDAANHASLIDGCRLSRARVLIYDHADPDSAARALSGAGDARRRFVLTESLFSMDGDRAPLAALAKLAHRFEAHLIVDEAHAFGVLGPGGRGLCAALGVAPAVRIGTLGKAFGTAGGFVGGSALLRRALVNRARTFIYTTAQPPLLAEASLASLQVIDSPEGDSLRKALFTNVHRLSGSLAPRARVSDQIVPFHLGTEADALAAALRLRAQGILAIAIRPPTVPENTARLRITLSAAHSEADIHRLLEALPSLTRSPAPGRPPGPPSVDGSTSPTAPTNGPSGPT